MSTDSLIKPIPTSIAVFGAGGRMGVEVAAYLDYAQPGIRLRLLTSSEAEANRCGRASPIARLSSPIFWTARRWTARWKACRGYF